MKIYINYESSKKHIYTNNYQSVKSIIYQYLCENTISDDVDNFFTYLMKNPIQVIICLLISLLPIIILPLGFISTTSCLIKVIIEKSITSIGKYLVCTLGKITLFSRIKLLIVIVKYISFLLMIFVIITLPLLILCITMKGYSIIDNPNNMCGAISVGNTTGFVLTIIFVFIYLFHRSGNYIINFII